MHILHVLYGIVLLQLIDTCVATLAIRRQLGSEPAGAFCGIDTDCFTNVCRDQRCCRYSNYTDGIKACGSAGRYELCLAGYFRSSESRLCESCPTGKHSSDEATSCSSCPAGSWNNSNICTDCIPVTGASPGATYTCTSATDSRVSACDGNKYKTVGATGATDTCTDCVAVDGAKSDATYTCTSATTSRVSTCATATPKKTVGTTGADTCTASCADGTWVNSDVCTPCTDVTGAKSDATYNCSSATDSSVSACAAGFELSKGTCFSCGTCMYTDLTSGTCPVDLHITTVDECKLAAQSFRWVDTVDTSIEVDSPVQPTGCFLHRKTGLHFNRDESSTSKCSSSFKCACKMECTAGKYQSGRICTKCKVGTFSTANQKNCTAYDEKACLIGMYATNTASVCELCAANEFNNRVDGTCVACQANQTSSVDRTKCISISAAEDGISVWVWVGIAAGFVFLAFLPFLVWYCNSHNEYNKLAEW